MPCRRKRSSSVSEIVLYHCQQGIEKALKGFLAWHDRPLRKTHHLEELVDECTEIEPGFRRFREPAAALQLARDAMDFITGRLPPQDKR